MTEAAAPTDPRPEGTCCGQGGAWAPAAGQPVVIGCMLCPNSTRTYWRTHRADGKPYRPVPALGSPADG